MFRIDESSIALHPTLNTDCRAPRKSNCSHIFEPKSSRRSWQRCISRRGPRSLWRCPADELIADRDRTPHLIGTMRPRANCLIQSGSYSFIRLRTRGFFKPPDSLTNLQTIARETRYLFATAVKLIPDRRSATACARSLLSGARPIRLASNFARRTPARTLSAMGPFQARTLQ
jgi:hypothetical protein